MVTGTEKLSNNGAETTKKISTEEQLKKLKEEIEGGKFNFEIIKGALDNLPEGDNKAFVLGAIFSGLNKLGISIERINNGKITLRLGKQNIKGNPNIASYEEAVRYETILNSNFKSGKISHSDIVKAQMYRTGTIDDYIEEVGVEDTSTGSYIERLLNKHNIKVLDGNISNITEFKSEEEYNHLINTIKVMVKDSQADREFLVNYFEYIKINNKKPLDEGEIKNYKRTSDKIENGILNELESLTPEQKWSLGIGSKEEAKEAAAKFKNNPIDAVLDTFNNGGGALGLVLGIIGAIFFGKNGALGGFLAGMGIVGGSAFAGELGKLADKKGNGDKNQDSGNSQEGKEDEKNNKSGLEKEYISILNLPNGSDLKKDELEKIYSDLFRNSNFIEKNDSSILDIFKTEKDFEKIKEIFKNFGIDLNNENKKYYEYIFNSIKEKRVSSIGSPLNGETLKSYLERNKKEDEKKEDEVKNETLSDKEKNDLIKYFKIDSNKVKTLIEDLNGLGLNLFQLLKGYKDFINSKLGGLDSKYKAKIIESIGKKVSLIGEEIKNVKEDNFLKNDFENNRWIINDRIKSIFEEINNRVIPSAYFLTKYDENKKYTKDQKEKINRIKEMFDSEITESGEFDKKFWSSAGKFEVWDSTKNNWEVFDISDEKDLEFMKSIGFIQDSLLDIDLLSEEDKEIENDAMLAYLIATGIQIIPYAGAVVSVPAMVGDVVGDEDGTIKILKTLGIVPEEYRMDKNWWDHILGGVGLAATIFGVQGAVKGVKLTEKFPKLAKIKFDKFEDMLQGISNKLGMSKEHTNFISSKLKNLLGVGEDINKGIQKFIPENYGLNDAEKAVLNSWGRIEKKINIQGEEIVFYLKKGKKGEIEVSKLKKQDGTILEGKNLTDFINPTTSIKPKEIKVFKNFAKEKILTISPGETKTIGGVEVKNVNRTSIIGKYEYEYKYVGENGSEIVRRGGISDVLKVVKPEELKKELSQTGNFEGIIKSANLNKAKDVQNHRVIIENGELVITNKSKVKLTGEQYDEFISNNLHEILKKFGVNIDSKVSNPRIDKIKEISDKIASFSDKSKKILPEKWKKINWILKELTQPGRTIAQLIDTIANSTNKKSDIAKILILGDRSESYKKLGNYARLGINAGLAGSLVIFDEDTNVGDLAELLSYNSLGLIWGGVTDSTIED
ncbi:hypothetical protein HUU51_00720 [Candidatus Gracilibacteria bacterium]|nr:hypothetical protein [Candidatus Gracilibacteria bacterium]